MHQDTLRSMILDGSMSKPRAVSVLNNLEDQKPWYTRQAYLQAMAALSAVYPQEMKRKTYMQSRPMCQVLHAYTAPAKLEWLWNGLRMRHRMPRSMLNLLGSGTSPNEALHSEINRWYRNQPSVFPTTLSLQLQVGRLGKLLAHNAALYRPTLQQFGQDVVLAAACASLVFDGGVWNDWMSQTQPLGTNKIPPKLPLKFGRQSLQRRIRAAGIIKKRAMHTVHVLTRTAVKRQRDIRKRPASYAVTVMKRPAAVVSKGLKRTPFNLKRVHV
jgi:hypothetical protein